MTLITTRTEEGLPFIPALYMRIILEGIMARAQILYPVQLCHYLWMGNHLHFIIYVEDPEIVEAFMARVKTESAHAINRLLGRRRRTIWVGDYDSATILTLDDAIEKIRYLYANPAEAHCADSIEGYKRPSSWKAFISGELNVAAPWIQRPAISPELVTDPDAARVLIEGASTSHELILVPNAWMKAFNITDPDEKKRINASVVKQVLESEESLRILRTGPLFDDNPEQRIDQPYTPKKFGRRMWCICWEIVLRVAFINMVKAMLREGKEVRKAWKSGNFFVPYPPGLAPPRYPRIANIFSITPLTLA